VTRGDLLRVCWRRDAELKHDVVDEVLDKILLVEPSRPDVGVARITAGQRGRRQPPIR
jgi:hypothetical protein